MLCSLNGIPGELYREHIHLEGSKRQEDCEKKVLVRGVGEDILKEFIEQHIGKAWHETFTRVSLKGFRNIQVKYKPAYYKTI